MYRLLYVMFTTGLLAGKAVGEMTQYELTNKHSVSNGEPYLTPPPTLRNWLEIGAGSFGGVGLGS